jgi:hypothetical protein
MSVKPESDQRGAEIRARSAAQGSSSFLGEFFYLLRRTRKWWAVPVVVVLLALGALFVLTSTAAAPLIYTLF